MTTMEYQSAQDERRQEFLSTIAEASSRVQDAIYSAENSLEHSLGKAVSMVGELEEQLADLQHLVDHELHEISTSLPCDDGIADFAAEVARSSFDHSKELARLAFEAHGRMLAGEPSGQTLLWLVEALERLAVLEPVEASEEVPELLTMMIAV